MEINIPKKLEESVFFSRWCNNHKLDSKDVAELRTIVNLRAELWIRDQDQFYKEREIDLLYEKIDQMIDDLITKMGLENYHYPGLYPIFDVNGYKQVMLPEIKMGQREISKMMTAFSDKILTNK